MYWYILDDDHNAHITTDLNKWAEWMAVNSNKRRVDYTVVGDCEVSTVFLGLNREFRPNMPPVLFETMVFHMGDSGEEYLERYRTWEEAKAGHLRAILRLCEGGQK